MNDDNEIIIIKKRIKYLLKKRWSFLNQAEIITVLKNNKTYPYELYKKQIIFLCKINKIINKKLKQLYKNLNNNNNDNKQTNK